ncbi:transposase [Gordonia polyisoprenivorans]|nr:transposase [Gordonia polyisoprenivorans]
MEAARRVIDGHQPISQVARDLNIHENLLGKWVRAERLRDGVIDDRWSVPPDTPLSDGERAELLRLRAEAVEKDRDIAFLKKVSAYFAAQQHK